MSIHIKFLPNNAGFQAASQWLCETIKAIGPGFHFDTPPHEYVNEYGNPSLGVHDARRLARALPIVENTLGRDILEAVCLVEIWHELGVRFDPLENRLIGTCDD